MLSRFSAYAFCLLLLLLPLAPGHIVEHPYTVTWVNVLALIFFASWLLAGLWGGLPFKFPKGATELEVIRIS